MFRIILYDKVKVYRLLYYSSRLLVLFFSKITIGTALLGNVPTKNKTNRALGRWVSTQRSNHKKFKRTGSTAHPRMDRKEMNRRTSRLNGINFSWSLLPGNTQSEENIGDHSESSSSSEKTIENKRNDDKEEKNESKRNIDRGDDEDSNDVTSV